MIEIERKFKLKTNYSLSDIGVNLLTPCYDMSTVYLDWHDESLSSTRIRFEQNCHDLSYKCVKTIKHQLTGMARTESEVEIDYDSDGILAFAKCKALLSKKRYILPYSNDSQLKWEIDVYDSPNIVDIIVEIEIPTENYQLVLPEWVGDEVTHDQSYSNLQLFISENTRTLY